MMMEETMPESVKSFLEKISLFKVVKTFGYIVAIAGPIWAFAGTYVTSLADDAVIRILKKRGIDPQSFQGMQLQLQEIEKSIEKLKSEKKGDVEEIKRGQEEILKILKGDPQ